MKVTTETDAQIPGSDMEDWTSKKETNLGMSWNYYDPNDPWYSNNVDAFAKTSAGTTKSAQSSVDYASTAHGGSNAGMVRTVGRGASTAFASNPNDVIAGEMSLGKGNAGTVFTSRPSALKFWAIYAPHNTGDQGLCEVSVLDANGAVIASGSIKVSEVSSYTQQTIPLNYARGAGKAATIKVLFRSTATDNFLNNNGVSNNNNHFSGSYMYIDDVELAY